MKASTSKIVIGAKLRSNDKRTLGKEVEITDVIRHVEDQQVIACYKAGVRTAKVNSNDIYVDGYKIARGWALVGAFA